MNERPANSKSSKTPRPTSITRPRCNDCIAMHNVASQTYPAWTLVLLGLHELRRYHHQSLPASFRPRRTVRATSSCIFLHRQPHGTCVTVPNPLLRTPRACFAAPTTPVTHATC